MAFLTLQDLIIAIKKHPLWFLWDVFVFLVTLAILGSTLYISALLIPVITSALALSLLPHLMISLITLLPLIVTAALVFLFLYENWKFKKISKYWELKFPSRSLLFNYFYHIFVYCPFIRLAYELVWRSSQLKILLSESGIKISVKLLLSYVFLSALVALSLGIYLSVTVLPSLMAALITAIGMPYGMAVLFAVLAAVVFIMLIYNFLITPLRLMQELLKLCYWYQKQFPDLLASVFSYLTQLTGVFLAIYTSYLLFPMIINILLPLLPEAAAVFTTIAICASLVILTMITLPIIVRFLTDIIQKLSDKFKNEPSKLTQAFKKWEVDIRKWFFGRKGKDAINLDEELALYYCSDLSYPENKLER